jgi:hypothetical protein
MEKRLVKKYFLLICIFSFASCGGADTGGASDGLDSSDHRVFVTSSTTNGEFLAGVDDSIVGVAAADQICEDLADSAGLTRTYKAIISDDSADAKTRLFITGAIYTVAGSASTLIANTETEFWAASSTALINDIDRDESGTFISDSSKVWTGSSNTGTKNTENCNDWKVDTSGTTGSTGQLGYVNGLWLDNTEDIACNQYLRLYCISQ